MSGSLNFLLKLMLKLQKNLHFNITLTAQVQKDDEVRLFIKDSSMHYKTIILKSSGLSLAANVKFISSYSLKHVNSIEYKKCPTSHSFSLPIIK